MENGMTLTILFCIHTYMILKNNGKLYLRFENKNVFYVSYILPLSSIDIRIMLA